MIRPEASDLQADPAHKGLLILTATIRNRAPYAVGFPYLELSLTDAQDQAVVRRALAPADYAGGTATWNDIKDGAALNGWTFVDAKADFEAIAAGTNVPSKLLGIAQDIVEDSTAADANGFDTVKWLGQWIERPQPALGGRKPADYLDTPTGVEIVTQLLGAMRSGAYL